MTYTSSRFSSGISFLLKAVITAGIFAFLLSRLDLGAVGQAMLSLDLPLFALSFIILAARNIIGGFRHKTLLAYMDCRPGLFMLTRLYFISAFFSMFLPTVVGGDIARAYYLYRFSGNRSDTISTIIVERALGVYAMMILSLAAVGLALVNGMDVFRSGVIRLVFVTFCAGLGISLLFFSQRFERLLLSAVPRGLHRILSAPMKIAESVGSFRNAPGILANALVLSLVFQFISILSTFILGISLGIPAPFYYYLMFLPVIWLISMLPVSINGLGVRESAYVVLFGIAGVANESALALGLMWFMQAVLLGAIGGVDFLIGGHDYAGILRFGKEKK